jgi:FkbM family methyltransferase
MVEKFYTKTGMYVDWQQIESLPEIDTLIDIGVGPKGTEDLYRVFKNANLILIDPIDEAKEYANKLSKDRKVVFIQSALGKDDDIEKNMKLQKERGFTSFLEIAPINMEDDYTEIKKLKISKLDTLLKDKNKLGRIGIKIDVEGYELDVVLGAIETLKFTKFVIAEVRHNHESLIGAYKIHEFMNVMNKNNFTLSKILTAKPFIADLCFQSNDDLQL